MVRAFETVLGNNTHKKELCLTEDGLDLHPSNVTKSLDIKIQPKPWHRKEEDDKETEYFCRNLYCPHKGGFFSLEIESIGLGNRHCHSCKAIKSQEEKNTLWYSESSINFTYQGIHYEALDFLYISPSHFEESQNGNQSVIEDDEDSMPKAIRFYRPEDFNEMDAYLSDIHTAKLPLVGVVSEDCLECPDHHSSKDNLCLV
nr:DNA cytosine-5-methyltransferase [Ipomoea batatas]